MSLETGKVSIKAPIQYPPHSRQKQGGGKLNHKKYEKPSKTQFKFFISHL
jgi:hypothetical protein